MAYIRFLNKITANSKPAKRKLVEICKVNKNNFNFGMPISYGLIKNLDTLDQLIYLRDHFVADENDQIFVSFREAESRCKNYFTRETIKSYCTERFDSKGKPWIRSQEKSPDKISPINRGKGIKELEVWLPDVLCFALVMSTFETLEKKTDIINKKKINGKFAYEYAPLSDEASQKTAIEHKGGIFLEIFTNFSNSFSPETLNLVKAQKSKLKSAHDLVVSQLGTNT